MTDISMTGGDLRSMRVFSETAYKLPWRTRRRSRSGDIELRESLELTETESASAAVFPGEAATTDTIGRERARDALVDIVQKFAVYGLSWSAEGAVKISSETANAAAAFFHALPARAALPRISPDGEGGLLMAWETRGDLVVAVLAGWRIHLVAAATTPRARYLDDLLFDGEQIPRVILESIPAR